MKSYNEKLIRYLYIWLVLGAVMVIAACVTHWETLKVFFTSGIDALFSGMLTIVVIIFIVYTMLGGRLR